MQLSKLMKDNLEKATEAELTSENNLLMQVGNELKSLPADKVAKASNGTDQIHNIEDTATEADLVAGNYFVLDGANGTKKLGAENVVDSKSSHLPFSNGRVSYIVNEMIIDEQTLADISGIAEIVFLKNHQPSELSYKVSGIDFNDVNHNTILREENKKGDSSGIELFEKGSFKMLIDWDLIDEGITKFSSSVNESVRSIEYAPTIKNILQDENISSNKKNIEVLKDRGDYFGLSLKSFSNVEKTGDLQLYADGVNEVVNATPGSDGVIYENVNTRSVVIACDGSQTYTISLPSNSYHRFSAAEIYTDFAVGIHCSVLFTQSSSKTIQDGRDYFKFTTSSTAKNIVVWYYNASLDSVNESEIRKYLMLSKGDVISVYKPYFNVMLNNDSMPKEVKDVENSFVVSAEKSQIFDNSNAEITTLFGVSNVVQNSNGVRSIVLKCKSKQNYTISIKSGIYNRFALVSCASYPSLNSSCIFYFDQSSTIKNTINGRDFFKVITSADAEYLLLYYYNASKDSRDESEIRETIMVAECFEENNFSSYKEVVVAKDSAIYKALEHIDPINSIEKVFGVEFITDKNTTICNRIGDAFGKKMNFAIGNSMAYDCENDFDNIFPWSEIRRCNVLNGSIVAYDGDSSFKTDGSNGDVMVEIPKFYSMRKVIGNKEQIAISGTKKFNFKIEPAFIDTDGNELDYIYVGAYATSKTSMSSVSGDIPKTETKMNDFISAASLKGFGVYDFAVLSAIQKLVIIENADKDVSKYYMGYGDIVYFGNVKAAETVDNVNSFKIVGNNRISNFRVGQMVAIGNNVYSDPREITSISAVVKNSSTNNYECTITISGNPVSVVANETNFYGTMQKNGGCDSMNYHTGRAGENGITACRYRWMENLWGNVWMQTAGVVIKDLKYYIQTNTSKYLSSLDEFEEISFSAPEQNKYPGTIYGWVKFEGLDKNVPYAILPSSVDTNKDYYNAKLYTIKNTDADGRSYPNGTEFVCVSGGGWDHSVRNNILSLRFWSTRSDGASLFLYGSRLVKR